MRPINEYPKYVDAVLHELELLQFPTFTAAATVMGVPEEATAKYMSLMMKSSFIVDESPSKCAIRIHREFTQVFEDALLSILMGHITFPSE